MSRRRVLLLYAIELQDYIWRTVRFHKFFLYWDKPHSKFNSVGWSTPLIWNLTLQVFLIFLPFLGIYHYLFLYGLWKQISNQCLKWVINLLFCLLLCGVLTFEMTFFWGRTHSALCLNQLVHVHQLLYPTPKYSKLRRMHTPTTNVVWRQCSAFITWLNCNPLVHEMMSVWRGNRKFDGLGVLSCLIVVYLAVAPCFILVCHAYMYLYLEVRVDTLSTFVESLVAPGDTEVVLTSAMYVTIMFLYYLLILMEIFPVMSFTCTLFLLVLAFRRDILQALQERSNSTKTLYLKKYVDFYRIMYVLTLNFRQVTDSMVTALMTFGYIVFMLLACINVLFWGVFPIIVLLFTASLWVIISLLMICLLPYLPYEYKHTLDLLREWRLRRFRYMGFKGKALKKEVVALAPVCFHFASIRKLDSEARKEYLDSVSGRSITLCMLTREVIN